MATNYPDGLDSFVNPTGTDALSSPAHAAQHANVNDAVEAIEATLGLNPEGSYTDVSDRLDALVTDAAAAGSAFNDAAQAAMGSAILAAGSAQSYSVDSYSYSQFASTDADLASAAAGSAVASATAAAASAASAASSAASVDATATTAVEFRQFAADGSVLANLPARVHPAEQLLKQAVWWIDAAHSSASGQTVSNLGWGGSALDAQCGSTGSADSNDPKYLAWEGENYVYLPGAAGNYLSVPDEAALDITGDIDIRVKVAMDDWTPGATSILAAKRANATATEVSWVFYVTSSGVLNYIWSSTGTSLTGTYASSVATGISDGAAMWVRITHDVDNGAGGSDIKFWTSGDGATWSQLGSTRTHGSTTSIYASTSIVEIGSQYSGANGPIAAKTYRAQVLDGIDGTPVLDVDCSQIASGADTSFTALTGQTVTINRSTSGRKTVGVVHPRWLFGTDDYMQVADNDLIDFGASDSFTVLAVLRQWATPTNYGRYVSKWPLSGAGWHVSTNVTAAQVNAYSNDGSASKGNQGPVFTAGTVSVVGMRLDRDTALIAAITDGTASTGTSATGLGSIANSAAMTIGRTSAGANYQDFEFVSAAIWRRALTAGEIATLNSYFQGRDA